LQRRLDRTTFKLHKKKTKNISQSTKVQAEIKKGQEAPPPKPQSVQTNAPSKGWDPQKEIQGGGVSNAKNRFLQQNTPEPKPSSSGPPKKWEPPKTQNVQPPQPPRETQPVKVTPPPPKIEPVKVTPKIEPVKVTPPPPKFEPPPVQQEYIVEETYVEQTYEDPQTQENYQEQVEYQEEYKQEEQVYQEEYPPESEQLKTCDAVYEYVAVNEGELSFYVGDVIVILDDTSEDGWWLGRIENSDVQGYFPSNFVQMRT